MKIRKTINTGLFKITRPKLDLTGFKFLIMFDGKLEFSDTVIDWKPRDRGCICYFDKYVVIIEPCSSHAMNLFIGKHFDRELRNYIYKNKLELNCIGYDEPGEQYYYETYLTKWNDYKTYNYRVAIDVWKFDDYKRMVENEKEEG